MAQAIPRVVASLLAIAAVLDAPPASACPVCGQGAPGTERALLVMTGILSALPLLMAGGIIAWIVLRGRAADGDSPDGSADGAGAPDPGAGAAVIDDPPPAGERATVGDDSS